MTRKNVRHIPTEAELVDRLDSQAVRLDSQAVRAMFMENWPGKKRPKQADVEGFMKYALADARIYIRDALKHTPKQVPGTDEPLGTPIEEATTDFSRNLQITYTNWKGRMAPFTATNGWRGSSGKILREYLHLLGAPFNATRWINELQGPLEQDDVATYGSARWAVRSEILSTNFVWSRRRGAWRFKRNNYLRRGLHTA